MPTFTCAAQAKLMSKACRPSHKQLVQVSAGGTKCVLRMLKTPAQHSAARLLLPPLEQLLPGCESHSSTCDCGATGLSRRPKPHGLHAAITTQLHKCVKRDGCSVTSRRWPPTATGTQQTQNYSSKRAFSTNDTCMLFVLKCGDGSCCICRMPTSPWRFKT